MFKHVPDPPEKDAPNESDPTSPYSSTDSKKLHEAADSALDHYLCPPGGAPIQRKTRSM